MKKTKKKKLRKPSTIKYRSAFNIEDGGIADVYHVIDIDGATLDTKSARKLADWLIRASDWLEQQKT